jgi:hypothetical protein
MRQGTYYSVVAATINHVVFVVVHASIGDMEWLILNYLCHGLIKFESN